ncbi:phosphoribulokinase [Rarobacter incanus]|nr:phosphoribulokinase [Rarobacter incanus]
MTQLAELASREPHPLVAIDGRSGAGKTVAAAHLGAALRLPVVHLDDFVPGWDGLRQGVEAVRHGIALPAARGQRAGCESWDWNAGGAGPFVRIDAAAGLIIEGCGAAAAVRGLTDLAVWIAAPTKVRMARLEGRSDWDAYAPHAAMWALQESALVKEFGWPRRKLVL